MQTIPGIHLATGFFHHAQPVDERTIAPDRHAAGARLGGWLSAGVDSRYVPTHTHATHEAGVTVLFEGYLTAVAGHADVPTTPAATVLSLYLESGLDFLSSLRGSYTGLILDSRTSQAHLFNDRRASRPLFCRVDAGHSVLVGPEVIHLASAKPELREIDPVAVCEFLIFASYYNDRTLFPGIKKLPPAVVMSLGTDSLILRRYWEINIAPDKPPIDYDVCIEEALALLDQSIRRLMTLQSRPFLFLSGGIDSRVILGSLRSNGFLLPTVSYGTQEGDDAPIARQLAEHCGMPFTFHPIDTNDPQRHFADAARRSDCRAETIDTPSHGPLLDQLSASFDLFVHGDKSFYGKSATTPAQALASVSVFSFAEAARLSDMLDPATQRHAGAELDHTLREIVAAGSAIDPQDLKDKVYYEQRLVNRQNAFAAENLRQLEQARPWLDEDLVDYLFAALGGLRKDKLCNRKMLEKAYPDLIKIPFASHDSIPQARTYREDIPANPALSEYIRVQFNERFDPRLAALFRPDCLAALVESLANGAPFPLPSIYWWQALPGMWRVIANRYRNDRIHPVSIMLRLMQINLYLQALDATDTRH